MNNVVVKNAILKHITDFLDKNKVSCWNDEYMDEFISWGWYQFDVKYLTFYNLRNPVKVKQFELGDPHLISKIESCILETIPTQ